MQYYATTMFAAGLAVPILAAMNAALGRSIAAPYVAGAALLAVGFTTALIVAIITGPGAITGAITKLSTTPKHLLLAGILVAFYVLSVTVIAPKFGVGNAIFFVLIGQLCSAAIIDHFGLFGATITPLTLKRGLGIALMACGVVLTQTA